MENEESFQLVMHGIQNSVILLDTVGVIRTWNRGAEYIHGYSADEIIGKHVSILYPTKDRRESGVALKLEIARTNNRFEGEDWHVCKDGRSIWAKTTIVPRKDRSGQLAGYWKVVRDLTEQRAAEHALRLSQARYEGIVRLSEDAIISIDGQQKITMFNQAAEKIFGYAAAEILGRTIDALIPQRFAAVHHKQAANFVASPDALRPMNERGAIFGQRKDGSEFPAEASISKFEMGGEKVLTVRLRDISERRKVEEAVEARRLAEAATAAKSSFLATMSHEIRTPLNGLLGVLGLLCNNSLSTEQRELLEMADSSGKVLLLIVNDILDLSKIEAGHLGIEEIPFDLRELLQGVTKLFEAIALTKRVALRFIDDDAIRAGYLGDPNRIRQVVSNLLSNAIKFTEDGSIAVRVSQEDRLDERECVRIEVADTGIGVSEEAQSRIFESFVQADRSTSRRYGGTGLGLALSRQLVELMGGSITLTSQIGVGSVFTVKLFLKCDYESGLTPQDRHDNAESAKPLLHGLKVLVAEDNRINRLLARRCLEDFDCVVTTAEDGVEAVELWENGGFDVILMDCQMPRMDGYEATRCIRQREESSGKRIPIVALTANAYPSDRERCLSAGMDEHVSKPFDSRYLAGLLVRIASLRQKIAGSTPLPGLELV